MIKFHSNVLGFFLFIVPQLALDEVDVAVGSDQGGSLRVPDALCGVVALKPTYGLVSYTGAMSLEPTLDHHGPMAKTVTEVAQLLEVSAIELRN